MANKKRLIDANALIFCLGEEPMVWSDGEAEIQERNDWRRFKACVEAQDTIDAVEVVHTRWITDDKGVTYCENCRHIDDYASVHNYCPFCGANMKGENNNG